MKKVFLAATFVAALMIQACNSGQNSTGSGDSSAMDSTTMGSTSDMATDTSGMNPASSDPKDFMEKAAVGGLMEVEAGKIAQTQASSQGVKDFAALMVKDHSAANKELMGIAEKKSVTLPTSLPAAEQQHLDAMRKMSGADFDKHYIGMMVQDHDKTVSLFKAGSRNPDTEVSGFATKTLPIIEAHAQKATELQGTLK
jgi:putative membrane protein